MVLVAGHWSLATAKGATSTSNQHQQPAPATSTSNQHQQPAPSHRIAKTSLRRLIADK